MYRLEQTVAIVDADPLLRKALARLLFLFGYDVELFDSAAGFLDVTAASKATCLLIAVELGETSGLHLAEQLFDRGFEGPIILMSTSDDDTIRQRSVDLGCAGYLHKPFTDGQLIDAIERAVGSKLHRG